MCKLCRGMSKKASTRKLISQGLDGRSGDRAISFLAGVLDAHQYLIEAQKNRIEALEDQVARLLDAVPSAGEQ